MQRRGEAAWPNARRTEGPFSPATREAELGRPQGKLELRSKKKTGENLSFSCRGQKRNFAASSKNGRDADLIAIQVIQTNVGSRIFHTTSVFLIRDMGVDSISGNTKLASGQGNVPVTVAQCLADFDTS